MTARQIDDAATRLRDLGAQSAGDFALAVVATGLALAATQVRPALAMPFLVGAIGVGFLGVRAFVRRAFLVEDLAVDPDAYTIPAVQSFARRMTSLSRRRDLARWIRAAGPDHPAHEELVELAVLLEDEHRPLEPCSLVTLERWIQDPTGSFHDPSAPVAGLRSRLRGFLDALEAGPPAEAPQRDQRLH